MDTNTIMFVLLVHEVLLEAQTEYRCGRLGSNQSWGIMATASEENVIPLLPAMQFAVGFFRFCHEFKLSFVSTL